MNQQFEKMMDVYEQHIFGQRRNLELLITALLAGGHVLLEGVPGIGKTRMVRTLSRLIAGDFQRIQFTPDLLPSDITGSMVFNMKEGRFDTLMGPIFTNILLADEINRTPAKTQAALLEAMEEKQVTIHGETFALPDPFFVVATQNPVEFEGTYPLPEAQQDRFLFKLIIDYPDEKAEKNILNHSLQTSTTLSDDGPGLFSPVMDLAAFQQLRDQIQTVKVEDAIMDYIVQLVRKTRESDLARLGASPRAGVAIVQSSRAWAFVQGRDYVTPDDVKIVIRPALRHRIQPTPHVELEGGTSDQIIEEVVASVPVPR